MRSSPNLKILDTQQQSHLSLQEDGRVDTTVYVRHNISLPMVCKRASIYSSKRALQIADFCMHKQVVPLRGAGLERILLNLASLLNTTLGAKMLFYGQRPPLFDHTIWPVL